MGNKLHTLNKTASFLSEVAASYTHTSTTSTTSTTFSSTSSTSSEAKFPGAISEYELMTGKKHKIYVVSTSACDFVKIGYTGSTLISGVWKSYRRAYGEDMIIHRIFPAERRLEDLEIHRRLLPKYGMPEKGNEIYRKEHLSQLIRELCDWHSHPGYGPYRKSDLARFRVSHHTHLSQPPSSRSEKYPPYDIALRNPKKEAEHNIHDRTRASVAHQTKMKVSGGNSRNLPLRERNTLKVHPPISVENEFEVSYSPVHEITLLLKETL